MSNRTISRSRDDHVKIVRSSDKGHELAAVCRCHQIFQPTVAAVQVSVHLIENAARVVAALVRVRVQAQVIVVETMAVRVVHLAAPAVVMAQVNRAAATGAIKISQNERVG